MPVGELVPATMVHGRLGSDLVVRSCRVSTPELSALGMQSSDRWALCSDADGPWASDGGVPLRPWSLVRSRCDPASHRTTRRVLGNFSYESTTGALEPRSALRRCTRKVPRGDRGGGFEVRDGCGNQDPRGERVIHYGMKLQTVWAGQGFGEIPAEYPTLNHGIEEGPSPIGDRGLSGQRIADRPTRGGRDELGVFRKGPCRVPRSRLSPRLPTLYEFAIREGHFETPSSYINRDLIAVG